jgi:hypothetical protein
MPTYNIRIVRIDKTKPAAYFTLEGKSLKEAYERAVIMLKNNEEQLIEGFTEISNVGKMGLMVPVKMNPLTVERELEPWMKS